MDSKTYFLCSEEVVIRLQPTEVSKPFHSGYANDQEEMYYVAVLDFQQVDTHYKKVVELYNENYEEPYIDFWCRECTPGTIDVSKITLTKCKRDGLFYEIENITGLTTEKNRAMIIYNLAGKFNCTPIEFINKITSNLVRAWTISFIYLAL